MYLFRKICINLDLYVIFCAIGLYYKKNCIILLFRKAQAKSA